MSFTGDLPITAFFPREKASGKRRQSSAYPAKRRQPSSPDGCHSSKKQRTQKMQFTGIGDSKMHGVAKNQSLALKNDKNCSSSHPAVGPSVKVAPDNSQTDSESFTESVYSSHSQVDDRIIYKSDLSEICNLSDASKFSGIVPSLILSDIPLSEYYTFIGSSQSQPVFPENFASCPPPRTILRSPLCVSDSAGETIPTSQCDEVEIILPSNIGALSSHAVVCANSEIESHVCDVNELLSTCPISVNYPVDVAFPNKSSNYVSTDDCLSRSDHQDESASCSISQFDSLEGTNTLINLVNDFHDMFGEEEGSYPDDFPLSLR